MTRTAHSPSSEPKQIIILMFFRQTISILIKKAFSPPQSFNEIIKKGSAQRTMGRGRLRSHDKELTFDWLKNLMGHFFHTGLFNIFALFTRDFEQLRGFRMNGTPKSMNLKFHFASSPAFSPSPRSLYNGGEHKRLKQVKNADQNHAFPSLT